MLERVDPFSLAERQLEIDAQNIGDLATLDRKKRKLSSSSHGFLRGSATLFYEMLRLRQDLADGPAGRGWIVGDMHMENIGAYRTDDDEVVFDLNDFDDTFQGPWHLDVLRLTTSVLLASRAFDAPGPVAISLAEQLVLAHSTAVFDGALMHPEESRAIARLVEQCRERKREAFVAAFTEERGGERRMRRDKRTFEPAPEVAAAVPELVAEYVRALGEHAPAHAHRWRVSDIAVRLAGNGSLGRQRLWVLVSGGEEPRFIELKQSGPPAPAVLLGPTDLDPGARVVAGARALLSRPTYRLAPIPAQRDRPPFVGRRLRPEEDKLELRGKELSEAFPQIVRIAGGLLGRAHRRAANKPFPAPWTDAERARLVDRAVEMAALHEGAWLAYSRRVTLRP